MQVLLYTMYQMLTNSNDSTGGATAFLSNYAAAVSEIMSLGGVWAVWAQFVVCTECQASTCVSTQQGAVL